MTTEQSQLVELGLKAFGTIAPIIPQVLARTKDKEARALLEQMQMRYNEAQTGIFAAHSQNAEIRSKALQIEHDNFELKREISGMRDAHAKLVATHAEEVAKLKKDSAEQLEKLKAKHEEAIANLHEHYADPNRNSPFSSGLGSIENLI